MLEKPLAPLVDGDEPDEISPFSMSAPLPSLGDSKTVVSNSDRFRARTLSLADDPSGAAADFVERWLTQDTFLKKLNASISKTMATHQHNKKYIQRCYDESNSRALRVEIEKEFAIRNWWPGIAAKGH